MQDTVQFSVTRLPDDNFKVIAQDEKEIIRSGEISRYDIIQHLHFELDQLRPIK